MQLVQDTIPQAQADTAQKRKTQIIAEHATKFGTWYLIAQVALKVLELIIHK